MNVYPPFLGPEYVYMSVSNTTWFGYAKSYPGACRHIIVTGSWDIKTTTVGRPFPPPPFPSYRLQSVHLARARGIMRLKPRCRCGVCFTFCPNSCFRNTKNNLIIKNHKKTCWIGWTLSLECRSPFPFLVGLPIFPSFWARNKCLFSEYSASYAFGMINIALNNIHKTIHRPSTWVFPKHSQQNHRVGKCPTYRNFLRKWVQLVDWFLCWMLLGWECEKFH